jgi:hypothetical protein
MNICPLTLREANAFVIASHRHGGATARSGEKFAIGVEEGVDLLGVAIVGHPLSATFMDDYTAEVLRVCVGPDAPKGACSMLYAACWRVWRSMGGQRLITYTLKTETGASLRGAGWKTVGQTKEMLECKSVWKKKDHINRQWKPIYGQQKWRWQVGEVESNEKRSQEEA